MKLYFTCPNKEQLFESTDYRLLENHQLVEEDGCERRLEGTIALTSACPLCGEKHHFQVQEASCSLKGE